jgi:hypothetical protein
MSGFEAGAMVDVDLHEVYVCRLFNVAQELIFPGLDIKASTPVN